ncbi:MAG: MFS transporter [Alphaproteobacteria bacterium]|nr:MFS transporter [Alphaproteobacteria bacterium]
MFRIFLIGMMSGFPWVLIGSGLTLWLREDGLSRSAVGFASLIFSVYAINFMWAPLIDKIRIPFLTQRFGPRKAWILLFQLVIMLALLGWSMLDAATHLTLVIGLGLVIAIASASQDITLDALRIEQARADETDSIAAGAAVTVIGWWTGFKLGGLVMLLIADGFQAAGMTAYWQMSFLAMAVLMVMMNIALVFVPEAPRAAAASRSAVDGDRQAPRLARAINWLDDTVLGPLKAFFVNNGLKIGLAILAFVFLFKIGEAFMGKMSILFYRELGFSKSDIGLYSKGLGWVVTVSFTLVGGLVAMRFGTIKALFWAGVAMAGTNLMFTLLAWSGKSTGLFALAVVMDDLAAAFSNVIFVTFISLLVDRRYTATQFALLASIGTAGRTVFASSSGALVDGLGGNWGVFFIITAAMVIPSLVLLTRLGPKLAFKD